MDSDHGDDDVDCVDGGMVDNGLTPHEEHVAQVVETRVLRRVARWLFRRSTFRFIVLTLFFLGGATADYFVVHADLRRNCHSRNEFRSAMVELVRTAFQDLPVTAPIVIRVNNLTKPGGPLAPLDC